MEGAELNVARERGGAGELVREDVPERPGRVALLGKVEGDEVERLLAAVSRRAQGCGLVSGSDRS
jgi:hypothetical protein